MSTPKAFISYSWISSEHEAWVLSIAAELKRSGVDAVMDRWDLSEGDEANAFMDRLVSDPEFSRTMIVCDNIGSEHSDSRPAEFVPAVGVISSKICKTEGQNKFVVISTELNGAVSLVRVFSTNANVSYH